MSSSSGMPPITSSGIPGTRMVEGRTRNGKGSSEPISTSGFQARRLGLAQTLGQKNHRRYADAAADREHTRALGCGLKPRPIGPSTLRLLAGNARPRARVPAPVTL